MMKDKLKVLGLATVPLTLALATVASAAPEGDLSGDSDWEVEVLDEEQILNAEHEGQYYEFESDDKWMLEPFGSEFDLTLADAMDGESPIEVVDQGLEPHSYRARFDLELATLAHDVVIEDITGQEHEGEDNDRSQRALEAWRNALRLLAAIATAAGENAENFAMTGIYEGYLVSDNGTRAEAVVNLSHVNDDIAGTLVVLDEHMTIDAGCTVAEVPVWVTNFSADRVAPTGSSLVAASANIVRKVRIGHLFGSIERDANIDVSLDLAQDFDTLHAEIELQGDFPCSSAQVEGTFVRRAGAGPFGSPNPPANPAAPEPEEEDAEETCNQGETCCDYIPGHGCLQCVPGGASCL
ncbi:MAG: hypothetical protein ACE37F_03195 [Nannocystaceae bacterium]|nr:hypothetical protein [bacterium]